MQFFWLSLLTGLTGCGCSATTPEEEVRSLQGWWKVDGETEPMVFEGSSVRLGSTTFSITVDPGTTPKQIDMEVTTEDSRIGIYELDGNDLKIAFNSKVPTERPLAFDGSDVHCLTAHLMSDADRVMEAQRQESARLANELAEARREIQDLKNSVEAQQHQQPPPVIQVQEPSIHIEPEITFSSTPAASAADVIVKSVSVYSTKEDDAAWDAFDGAPDLKVYIEQTSLFGSSYETGVEDDTFSATFNAKAIRVTAGDTIRVVVYDNDALAGDIIGEYTKEITEDTLRERVVSWSFGRVSSLELEFQP
ncbi:MAG: hypothetical protein ACKVT0_04870 [Planctomycetaceae bacterium]